MNNNKDNTPKENTQKRRYPRRKKSKSKQSNPQTTEKRRRTTKNYTKMEDVFDDMAELVENGKTNELDDMIQEHCVLNAPINPPHASTHPKLKLISLFCCDNPSSFNIQHYVYSKESVLVPGERGLFAAKSFKTGDKIGVYCGAKVDKNASPSMYRLKDIEPRKGEHEHEMLCHYVNDISLSFTFHLRMYAKRIGSNHKKNQCKHRFENNSKFSGTLLEATRPINRNEEILVSYGYDEETKRDQQMEILWSSLDLIESLVQDECRDSKIELQEICEFLGVEKDDYERKKKKGLWELIMKELDEIE